MSTSRARTSRVFTISFPEPLAEQVEKIAREESRNISELFREAFRLYELQVIRKHIKAAKQRAGTSVGREEDIQAYVDEIRSARNRDKVA